MKKLLQKRKNNKGFSLVELIVVVAIMAVLIGVLVPTLIRNVEKSKHQKDITAIEEIRNAMEIAIASEKFSTMTATIEVTGGTITVQAMKAKTGTIEDGFLEEVCKNLNGENATTFSYDFTSKLDASDTVTTFTIGDEHVTASVTSKKYSKEDIK